MLDMRQQHLFMINHFLQISQPQEFILKVKKLFELFAYAKETHLEIDQELWVTLKI